MKLLTKGLEQRFKKIGSQEKERDPIVVAKFFNPAGIGTWYASEMYAIIEIPIINKKKNVNTTTQLHRMQRNNNKKKRTEMQNMLKQTNSKDEKKENRTKRTGAAKLQRNKSGKRICDNLSTKQPTSKKRICNEINNQNGKKIKKISITNGNGPSQKREQTRRQINKFGTYDKISTQELSHEKTEYKTMEINVSELKNYPFYKILEYYFFGYVSLFEDYNDEWGNFSLEELESIKGFGGLGIERDIYCGEKRISEFKINSLTQ